MLPTKSPKIQNTNWGVPKNGELAELSAISIVQSLAGKQIMVTAVSTSLKKCLNKQYFTSIIQQFHIWLRMIIY